MPAFYIMFFAALGGVALLTMKETAKRPLLGSFPTVETKEEAVDIVEHQDDNPYIDTSTMPLAIIEPPAEPAAPEPVAT